MNDPNKAIADALSLAIRRPNLDLVGPTVDDDIRRAIARYGAKAVTDAIKRQSKPRRRGPTGVVGDLPELRSVFEADARDWLSGGDPFATRSDYSSAKDFADKNPGQSHPSTMKRITRKLKAKRATFTLMTAEAMGKREYPYGAYLRTIEALIEKVDARFYGYVLAFAESQIADYEAKYGQMPAPEMPMRDIEVAIQNAFAQNISTDAGGFRGLFGLAGAQIRSEVK